MSDQAPSSSAKLSSVGLANFKAFGSHLQTIPLRPITLIFGPNSCGKSSLLHSLLWAKDVVCAPVEQQNKLDVYYPSAGSVPTGLSGSGQGVDLGGFRQFRHGNDPQTEVKMKLNLRLPKMNAGSGEEIEVASSFATYPPATDYKARLRLLVQERLKESLSKNSFPKLLENLRRLAEIVLKDCLTKLLAFEYGESTLELRLDDLVEEREDYMPTLSQLMAEASPKLFKATWISIDLSDLLGADDSSIVREEPTESASVRKQLTEAELQSELQNLASRVFDELNHKAPSKPEHASPSLVRFEIAHLGKPLLVAARDHDSKLVLQNVDLDGVLSVLANKPDPIKVAEWRDLLGKHKQQLVFDDVSGWVPRALHFDEDTLVASSSAEERHDASQLVELCSLIEGTDEAPGLLNLCAEAGQDDFKNLSYLGPIRAYPEREIKVADLPRHTKDANGWFAWREMFMRQDLCLEVNNWLKEEERSRVEVVKDHRVSWTKTQELAENEILALLTKHQTELYDRNSLFVKDVPGDQLGQFHESALAGPDTTDVSNALGLVSSRLFTEATGTLFLRDLKSGKHVSSRDIGVGISQLIPVLVQAMGSRNELILMEQPEIHLHPKIQAELGDVFIDSAMNAGNRFVLETHSEHLILRIMRRIRETASEKLPEGMPPLRKEDVAVLYVEQTPEGSIVREMPLNERGELVKAWPGGFFEEGFKEMFDS
jgi:hypothetical protein